LQADLWSLVLAAGGSRRLGTPKQLLRIRGRTLLSRIVNAAEAVTPGRVVVVIGADGYGFAKREDGSYAKITQSGPVVLEDEVEVQANATVDRAAVGETRIRKGAKVDNLVQVGHGSKVGRNTLLCAQVGLAGSTDVGDDVILTGQVGVAGHCRIGDGAIATAQTGIPSDVAPGKLVSGYPAIDNRLWLKCSAIFTKLPEMNKSLRQLQRKVEDLMR